MKEVHINQAKRRLHWLSSETRNLLRIEVQSDKFPRNLQIQCLRSLAFFEGRNLSWTTRVRINASATESQPTSRLTRDYSETATRSYDRCGKGVEEQIALTRSSLGNFPESPWSVFHLRLWESPSIKPQDFDLRTLSFFVRA